jgi:hypothetical protein
MERTRSIVSPIANILPLQRKDTAAIGGSNASLSGAVGNQTFLPALMERASNVAKQMRYFKLVATNLPFNEVLQSAKRAGFNPLNEDSRREEAAFQWSAGEPDFTFSVSLRDRAGASIVAESRGDIFGLILIGYSHVPSISVETNPSLGGQDLGRNAPLFRDIMLMFPDFDDLPAWTKY